MPTDKQQLQQILKSPIYVVEEKVLVLTIDFRVKMLIEGYIHITMFDQNTNIVQIYYSKVSQGA